MDEETQLFLKRIAESIGALLLWLMANIFFGIYKNYAFFITLPTWQNILYYLLFLSTGIGLFLYIKNKWRK
jgi:hypothetical protein